MVDWYHISRGRKMFMTAAIIAIGLNALTFALVFNPEPIRLQLATGGILDPEKSVIYLGGNSVTVNDFSTIGSIAGFNIGVALLVAYALAKNQ